MSRHKGEIFRGKDGWRWRVVAKNGLTVADSAEAYERQIDCRKMLKALHPLMRFKVLTGSN